MLTFEEAKRIALDRIGPEYGLIEEATVEKEHGWHFRYQTKKYLQTGDFHQIAVGSGGFIVDREDGHIVEFGSQLYAEQLEAYETGCRYDEYDLEIRAVHDFDCCVGVLLGLEMWYSEPEEEYGVVWRIRRPYTREVLERHLKDLPCKFSGYNALFAYKARRALEEAKCCTYTLLEHQGGARQRQV